MRCSLACLICSLVFSSSTANQGQIKPYDVPEAYAVYSAVLALEHSEGELLIADTTVPFNHCLEHRSDKAVDSVITDYKKVNRTLWRLLGNVSLGQNYKMLSVGEIHALQQPDPKKGFFWYFPEGTAVIHFSAVGFNAARTIAFVELDFQCGGLCGHGRPYVLEKREGQWQEYDESRNWKFGKLKKNKDGTFTGTMSGPGISVCSWNY